MSQGPQPTFVKSLYTLNVLLKCTSPNSLNLAWKVLKGDAIRLQPRFIIRRVYTSGCHKDDKGDWLHRGLSHSFWWGELLVWNLVFISPGGQFGCRYVIPMATRHVVQSSLKVQDGVSFFFKMQSAQPVPFLPQGHSGSAVACELLTVVRGIQFPDQGLNPGPVHWENRFLATGPPRMFHNCLHWRLNVSHQFKHLWEVEFSKVHLEIYEQQQNFEKHCPKT